LNTNHLPQKLPGHSYLDWLSNPSLDCTHQHSSLLKISSEQPEPVYVYKWSCWLMTPSVIFEPLSQEAGSVILASGTLAPIQSFKTELGNDFAARILKSGTMEGMHVIDTKRQLFAAILENGPCGLKIDGSYKARKERKQSSLKSQPMGFNSASGGSSSGDGRDRGGRRGTSTSFEMEIGHTIYYAMESIPRDGGILVFVTSYKMLNEMEKEWEETGLLRGFHQRRDAVVFEPRGGGQEAFDEAKDEFTDAVDGGGGGLLIAVFRGKMSEGISFNDNYCRAVFCVGIPFPSTKDLKIQLKMKYNSNRSVVDSDYLNGNYWYSLQAFRAVNQALGRCIRHLKDYGALFLIDSRYTDKKASLARWLSKSFVTYSNFGKMNEKLKEFYDQVPEELIKADAWGVAEIDDSSSSSSSSSSTCSSSSSCGSGSCSGVRETPEQQNEKEDEQMEEIDSFSTTTNSSIIEISQECESPEVDF
jgi:Fanconi anemia group J protein